LNGVKRRPTLAGVSEHWNRGRILLTAAITCAVPFIYGLALPADSAMREAQLAPCLAYHGATGQSVVSGVPSLGGQPVFYLTVQLLMFRDKLCVVEPMNQVTKGLKDDDLRAMAANLAELPPPEPVSGRVDTGRIERARALIEQHRCNFCH
jgi:cytochrome c553